MVELIPFVEQVIECCGTALAALSHQE